MKTHYAILPLLVVLFLVFDSCKKEDSTQEEGPELIESQTVIVTSEGGTYTINQFSINIPQGAIPTSVQMTFEVYDKTVISQDQNSNVLKIKNMTTSPSKPIQVKIGNNPAVQEASVGVEFLAKTIPYMTDEMQFSMDRGTQVNDTLVYTFDPANAYAGMKSVSADPYFEISIYSMTGYGWVESPNGTFLFSVYQGYSQYATQLATDLENFYDSLEKPPFNMDYTKRTKYPIYVYMYKFFTLNIETNATNGEAVESRWGLNSNFLSINTDDRVNKNYEQIKTTSFHELFHLIQSYYHSPTEALWLDEATATFAEGYAVNDPEFVPKTMDSYYLEPFRGFYAGQWNDKGKYAPTTHGYGMASLIKYLENLHGAGIFSEFYEQLKLGNNSFDIIRSIQGNVNHSTWYAEYLKAIITGNVYSIYFSRWVLEEFPEKWEMKNITEEVRYFKLDIAHLGGQLITIEPEKLLSELNDSASITARITESSSGILWHARIMAFSQIGSQPPVYLGDGTTSYTYKNLKILAQNKGKLYLLVVDMKDDVQTHETTKYDVEIQLVNSISTQHYFNCVFNFCFLGKLKHTYSPDSIVTEDGQFYSSGYSYRVDLEMESSTSYKSTFNVYDSNQNFVMHYIGNLTVSFNYDFSVINSFNLELTKAYDKTPLMYKSYDRKYTLAAVNIPREGTWGGTYRASGLNLLDYIYDFTYTSRDSYSSNFWDVELLELLPPTTSGSIDYYIALAFSDVPLPGK